MPSAGAAPMTSAMMTPLSSTSTARAATRVRPWKTVSVRRSRFSTALREAASAAVTLVPFNVMSVTSRPPESIAASSSPALRMKRRRAGASDRTRPSRRISWSARTGACRPRP